MSDIMNREITFRGRHYLFSTWIYGSLLRVDDNFYIVQNDDVEKDGHHLIFITDVPMLVDKETICQFTGFQFNGIDIYEHDVFIIKKTYHEVVYSQDKAAFVFKNLSENLVYPTPFTNILYIYDDNARYVGNVFDDVTYIPA